ncbi:MAG: YdeI/OmpD-associated family protein [Verrucomicrobiales bacterium]|nr:YdeI/OmpD-associated family protein [Verrucomicrobiales bacterium]
MAKVSTTSRFEARLLPPAKPGKGEDWSFLVLPEEVSKVLPRRGRTTVSGMINEQPFEVTLEPDGQLSHWMKIDEELRVAAGAEVGKMISIELTPVKTEPEPDLPSDFQAALETSPEAKSTWDATTTIARVDWIHWITTARQQKTRQRRIVNACEMLASGKRRVCCFDPSGFYSKAFSAPATVD